MAGYVDPNRLHETTVTADGATIAYQFKNNGVPVFTIYGDGTVSFPGGLAWNGVIPGSNNKLFLISEDGGVTAWIKKSLDGGVTWETDPAPTQLF